VERDSLQHLLCAERHHFDSDYFGDEKQHIREQDSYGRPHLRPSYDHPLNGRDSRACMLATLPHPLDDLPHHDDGDLQEAEPGKLTLPVSV